MANAPLPRPGHGPAITLRDLTKTYFVATTAGRFRRRRTPVHAVAGIDLTVNQGEMVGYLGPNGAGKSTTIKMITGILQPTSGQISVLGLTPVAKRRQLAHQVGVVFGQRSQLWWDLPLQQSFELVHHIYRTDRARHTANLAELTDRLDLGPFLETPVRQLSLGQRMRGELTAAFLHDPSLVVLDEPTIGLDVVSKHAIRQFLTDHNTTHGTTVILTTHDLDDVERICERMIIIDHGQVMLDSTVTEFKARHGRQRTLVVDLDRVTEPLALTHGRTFRVTGTRQWVAFDPNRTTAAQIVAEVTAVADVRDLSIEEPLIEDLLRRFYRETPDGTTNTDPTPD